MDHDVDGTSTFCLSLPVFLLYENFKPFLTDMWNAIRFACKHSFLDFQLFQIIQRSYS